MEFDVVIVGAGSAGCVLAERLSAEGALSVLVLEAGGEARNPWIKLPVGYARTFADPRLNWGYVASADPGLAGRQAYWPRGRVIGGSGSINAMAYVRGLPRDFADWEQAGAVGWGWDTVRRSYDLMETRVTRDQNGQLLVTGAGPVFVSDLSRDMHPFSNHFLQAAKEMGWPVVDDMNEIETEGVGRYRSSVWKGRRWSAVDAFLKPARKRQNVRVISGAMVERISVREGRANGVYFLSKGQRQFARARASVILSAGAINSPQLLQLSGIGPGELLQRVGVDVVKDHPGVGAGLQDHLAITHHFAATKPTLNNRLGSFWGLGIAALQYALTRGGALSVPVNQVGGYIRDRSGAGPSTFQLYCNPATYSIPENGKPKMGRDPGFILSVQPCRPTSRGHIQITSADPRSPPRISPCSLSTPHDVTDAILASLLLKTLAHTRAMKTVIKTRHEPDLLTMTEQEMLENFRQRAGTVFHPCGTCAMGKDDGVSVLDHRLRVRGLRGLRVVDASAFPNITSGNTNAPTMMLAYRASELIFRDLCRREE
ncbi:choline dehydrogenase [Aliiroseovarius crassostreae]|uniref:Choline dehydrogenase n=1 Tax=Aliiroseovarius crassostreae TaxID=154981 RepID=A0A0N8IB17_9RHOB|nr:GMC family oxidoreductase N-terminal domain-containing protein [Aliiroseovarius crassostreae]KPN61859.1 choline dehydrogenase [Aliiroseovarius crassostreae]